MPHDPPNGLDHVQSAAFQKDRARAHAFHNWEVDFHQERCISDFRAAVTGIPTNGHAHTHVILDAPSTHHHPLWSAAVDMEKDAQGARKPSARSTLVGPHPLHSRSQLTTHSRALTHRGSDLQTPLKLSHAPVAPPFVPHNTSHESACCSIKHALTTQSTLTWAHYPLFRPLQLPPPQTFVLPKGQPCRIASS
jgi:hypothetical protein